MQVGRMLLQQSRPYRRLLMIAATVPQGHSRRDGFGLEMRCSELLCRCERFSQPQPRRIPLLQGNMRVNHVVYNFAKAQWKLGALRECECLFKVGKRDFVLA